MIILLLMCRIILLIYIVLFTAVSLVYAVDGTEIAESGYNLKPPEDSTYGGYDKVFGMAYEKSYERDIPAGVTYISGDMIRERAYRDLGEVLYEFAGIYVEDIPGREGPQVTPYIRGLSSEHILLIIDGIPVNNLKYGWADVMTVPLESVDRVEIVRGGASARFGDRAAGGVIAVYTKQGPLESAKSHLTAADGTYDTERYKFDFGMTARGIDLFFGANRLFGHEPNTFGRIAMSNLDFRLGHRWGDANSVYLSTGNLIRDIAIVEPDSWDSDNETSYQDEHNSRVTAGGEIGVGPGILSVNGRYFAQRNWYESRTEKYWYSDNAYEGGGAVAYSIPHINDSNLLTIEAGAVYRDNRHLDDQAFIIASGRINESISIDKTPISISLGVGYDNMLDVGNAISPDIRAGFKIADWLKLYGSFSGGVLLPDLGSAPREGNENSGYKAPIVKSRTIEVGTELYFAGRSHLHFAGFQVTTENELIPDSAVRPGTIKRQGGELGVSGLLPFDIFYYDIAGTYIQSTVGLGDDPVPYIPDYWTFARLGYKQRFFKDDLTVCAELKGRYEDGRYVYRGGTGLPYDTSDLVKTPSRMLLGAFASFTIVSLEFYVDVENIAGDTRWDYRPQYNSPERARTYVGFTWTMFD